MTRVPASIVAMMGSIVKFLAGLLLLTGCAAVSGQGAVFSRSHPLLRVHALPSWESAYLPAEPVSAPPERKDPRPADRAHEAQGVELAPGQVPTGMPGRLALATTVEELPPDLDDAAEPAGLPLAAIRSRRPSLVDDARALIGQPLEPFDFLNALVETTTVSSAVAARADANPVRDLYVRLRRQKKTFAEDTPRVGDLVFFHNTRDLNTDNRNNDWYTSVGVVSRLDDGTVVFIAPGAREVQEMRLTLDRPRTRRDEKRQLVLNDYVRPKRLSDPAITQYLAGELFAGFGRL
jgi:hypothetical protein